MGEPGDETKYAELPIYDRGFDKRADPNVAKWSESDYRAMSLQRFDMIHDELVKANEINEKLVGAITALAKAVAGKSTS